MYLEWLWLLGWCHNIVVTQFSFVHRSNQNNAPQEPWFKYREKRTCREETHVPGVVVRDPALHKVYVQLLWGHAGDALQELHQRLQSHNHTE